MGNTGSSIKLGALKLRFEAHATYATGLVATSRIEALLRSLQPAILDREIARFQASITEDTDFIAFMALVESSYVRPFERNSTAKGHLQADGARRALSEMGRSVTDTGLARFMAAADPEQTGTVTFDRFLHAACSMTAEDPDPEPVHTPSMASRNSHTGANLFVATNKKLSRQRSYSLQPLATEEMLQKKALSSTAARWKLQTARKMSAIQISERTHATLLEKAMLAKAVVGGGGSGSQSDDPDADPDDGADLDSGPQFLAQVTSGVPSFNSTGNRFRLERSATRSNVGPGSYEISDRQDRSYSRTEPSASFRSRTDRFSGYGGLHHVPKEDRRRRPPSAARPHTSPARIHRAQPTSAFRNSNPRNKPAADSGLGPGAYTPHVKLQLNVASSSPRARGRAASVAFNSSSPRKVESAMPPSTPRDLGPGSYAKPDHFPLGDGPQERTRPTSSFASGPRFRDTHPEPALTPRAPARRGMEAKREAREARRQARLEAMRKRRVQVPFGSAAQRMVPEKKPPTVQFEWADPVPTEPHAPAAFISTAPRFPHRRFVAVGNGSAVEIQTFQEQLLESL